MAKNTRGEREVPEKGKAVRAQRAVQPASLGSFVRNRGSQTSPGLV